MPIPKPEEEVIFNIARRLDQPDARSRYIDRACGSDGELRRRIEALLRVDVGERNAVVAPAVELRATFDDAIAERPGLVIGPYKLLEQIGEGGFGVVFMAEQQQPVRRQVALKIVKPGMDTRQVVSRFEAERNALARMDHPHIARVFDGGLLSSGRPYFVMELVRGVPITEVCDSDRLSVRERLEMAIDVIEAVQHAHQKGIIHRDLKPSNVLVTRHDGTAVVKIIDFGIAKAIGVPLTDKTLFTGFAQFVGTPLYMSPEQMELSGLDIDTRADIYALGVLLYELLTGTTPFHRELFRTAAFDEVRRIVLQEVPARPSQRINTVKDTATVTTNRRSDPKRLHRLLRGELDWIVMKCLEKDRTRRYATARDLVRDLQRYLANEPVEARPPSVGYRLTKFLHRNRHLAAAGSLAALLLISGIVGTTWGLLQAREAWHAESLRAEAEANERHRAERAEVDARKHEQDATDKLELATALSEFLQEDLIGQAGGKAQADRKFEPKPNLTVREALDRAAETVGAKFQNRPEIEASVRHKLGSTYRDLSEPRKAVAQLRQAVDIRERVLGPNSTATWVALHDLGGALFDDGQYADSVRVFEQVRDRRIAVLGPGHADNLNTLNSLGLAYRASGRFREAVSLLKEVYQGRKIVHGPTHRRTMTTLDNLATTYIDAGEPRVALAMLEEVRDVRVRTLIPHHYDILLTLNNIAQVYSHSNRHDEAITQYRQIRTDALRTLGPQNHLTINVTKNLALDLSLTGQSDEAIALLMDLCDLRAKYYGIDHIETVRSQSALGATYGRARQFVRATPLLESAWKSQRTSLGDTNIFTLHTAAHLGNCYAQTSRLSDAIPLLEAAHRGSRVYRVLRQYSGSLMQAYLDTGRRADAIAAVNELIAADRESLAVDGIPFADQLDNNAVLFAKVNAWPEAEVVLRESYALRVKTEPDAWTTFGTQALLGGAMLGQKKYAEAEPLLLNGYAGMKAREDRMPKESRGRLLETLQQLVQLYTSWEKLANAASWKAELNERKTNTKEK